MVVAAGDAGYAAGPQFPADLPTVTAVGATNLVVGGGGARSTERAWTRSGGGCSVLTAPVGQNHLSGCAGRVIGDISVVGDPGTPVAVYDNSG